MVWWIFAVHVLPATPALCSQQTAALLHRRTRSSKVCRVLSPLPARVLPRRQLRYMARRRQWWRRRVLSPRYGHWIDGGGGVGWIAGWLLGARILVLIRDSDGRRFRHPCPVRSLVDHGDAVCNGQASRTSKPDSASQPKGPPRQDALCDCVDAANAYGVSAAWRNIRNGRDCTARMGKDNGSWLKGCVMSTMLRGRYVTAGRHGGPPAEFDALPSTLPSSVYRKRSLATGALLVIIIPRHDRRYAQAQPH